MVNNLQLIKVNQIENCLTTNYEINITEMIHQKYKIPMQYEAINIGGNSNDMHILCKKLDRYLLHVVEEISEFLDEFDPIYYKDPYKSNYHGSGNCLMELIDVIAYTTSILSLLYIDLHGLDFVKHHINELDINKNYIIEKKEIDSWKREDVKYIVDRGLLNAEKILINGIRRKFPERKWHKDTNRILSVTELNSLYIGCIDAAIKAIVIEVSLFLYLTNYNYDLFTKMFIYKNEQVYALKKE